MFAVLIVGYDFVRVSMATLSPTDRSADAAVVKPVLSKNEAPPIAHVPDLAMGRPWGTTFPELSPATIEAITEADSERVHGAVSQQLDRAARLHPALWQGQLAIGAAVWTCRRLEELPILLEDAIARYGAPAMEDNQTASARAGDRSRSPSHNGPGGHRIVQPSSAPSAPLILRNRTETGSAVHFLVNERAYALFPGEELELAGRRWLIRFHRGGDFGDAAYALWPGAYEFLVTSRGWDLVRKEH